MDKTRSSNADGAEKKELAQDLDTVVSQIEAGINVDDQESVLQEIVERHGLIGLVHSVARTSAFQWAASAP